MGFIVWMTNINLLPWPAENIYHFQSNKVCRCQKFGPFIQWSLWINLKFERT